MKRHHAPWGKFQEPNAPDSIPRRCVCGSERYYRECDETGLLTFQCVLCARQWFPEPTPDRWADELALLRSLPREKSGRPRKDAIRW